LVTKKELPKVKGRKKSDAQTGEPNEKTDQRLRSGKWRGDGESLAGI